MSGFLGSGDIYVNRKIGTVYQGWKQVGNATKFELKENSELKERISKGRSNYGSSLNAVYIHKPAECNITLDDLDRTNLGLVFLGTTSAVSVSGSTVTDEAVTGYKDHIFQTAKRKISSVVLTNAGATVTYVLNTDYEIVNADLGLIKVLAAGAITDGQSLLIDYAYGSMTSNKVAGGTNANVIMKVMFDGVNQATQEKAVVMVHEAVLSPQSGVDFLSDDFTTIELTGRANVPTGGTEAYTVETEVTYT